MNISEILKVAKTNDLIRREIWYAHTVLRVNEVNISSKNGESITTNWLTNKDLMGEDWYIVPSIRPEDIKNGDIVLIGDNYYLKHHNKFVPYVFKDVSLSITPIYKIN